MNDREGMGSIPEKDMHTPQEQQSLPQKKKTLFQKHPAKMAAAFSILSAADGFMGGQNYQLNKDVRNVDRKIASEENPMVLVGINVWKRRVAEINKELGVPDDKFSNKVEREKLETEKKALELLIANNEYKYEDTFRAATKAIKHDKSQDTAEEGK